MKGTRKTDPGCVSVKWVYRKVRENGPPGGQRRKGIARKAPENTEVIQQVRLKYDDRLRANRQHERERVRHSDIVQ